MSCAVFAFPEAMKPASDLSGLLGVPCRSVEVRAFPDGESLVRVAEVTQVAILYRSLDRPNGKLVELLLAASALRDGGAQRVMLLAPYLAYMRQDKAFHPGEAVSQRVIGRLIADHFDALATLDPHLHRIKRLDQAVPGIPAFGLSAAPALAAAMPQKSDLLLVGPDAESRPWVEAIAGPLGLDVLVGEKRRCGDREVDLAIPGIERVAGRPVVLVDDVISSGTTLIAAATMLRDSGAGEIEAIATHGLASSEALAQISGAGVSRIRTTLSVANPTACIPIADILANGVRSAGWIA